MLHKGSGLSKLLFPKASSTLIGQMGQSVVICLLWLVKYQMAVSISEF